MIFREADKAAAASSPNEQTPPAPVHEPAKEQTAPAAATPTVTADVVSPNPTPEGQPSPTVQAEVVPATKDPSASPESSTAEPDLKSDLEKANARIIELETAAKEKEADTALADYSDLPDETKAALRETYLADPAKAKALLAAMPKKVATTIPVAPVPQPPAPTHVAPGQKSAPTELSAEQKATEQNTLIKQIQGAGKFSDYTSAREEARRQKPELFS
jgi:hypothetical protein